VRYDCTTDAWDAIRPAPAPDVAAEPSEFGDDWSEQLEGRDVVAIARYFRSIERLARSIDSVTLRVGGVDHPVDLGGRRTGRSITFAVPRASLMRAIEWEIFDDLLIGNFMQATLHGKWPSSGLYPGFTPYVTKYADNGGARTSEELRAYFAEYRRRLGLTAWLRGVVEQRAKDQVRARVSADTAAYRAAKRMYTRAKRVG
jgi:hypothetical protein